MAHHFHTNVISGPPLALTQSYDDSGHVISDWQTTIQINMKNLEENWEENASQSSEMDKEQLKEMEESAMPPSTKRSTTV